MYPRQAPNFQQLSHLSPPSARIPGVSPSPVQLTFTKVQNELSEGGLALKKNGAREFWQIYTFAPN